MSYCCEDFSVLLYGKPVNLVLMQHQHSADTKKTADGLFVKNGVNYLVPFIMITTCFAMWGFANDVTNPMVQSFGKIFHISKFESSFVQVAFYLGYFVMAFPIGATATLKSKNDRINWIKKSARKRSILLPFFKG